MAAGMSLLLVFLLSVLAMPLPVAVPPLPEDPKLLRVAPSDTVAYLQWFGAADPDPNRRNATEALVAEPQVQQMLTGIFAALRAAAVRNTGGDEFGGEIFDLGMLALRRPGCVFLGRLGLPPGPDEVEAGLVINLGEDAQAAQLTLRKMESLLVSTMPPGMAIESQDPEAVDGVRFRALPLPAGGPPVSWAVVDGYVALAVGSETPAQIVRGLRQADEAGLNDHPAFNELRGEVRVARPCIRSFVDLGGIMQSVAELGGSEAEALKAIGLMDLEAVLSESGLEGDGFVARSLIGTSGRTGFLKLLDGAPLSAGDLAIVPGDASFAYGVSVDPLGLYRSIFDLVESAQPGAREQFRAGFLGSLERELGLKLEEDVLAHLGDALTMWSSPGQGGLLITGFTAALSLDNAGAFRESFEKIMARVREGAPVKERSPSGRLSRNVYLEETDYADHRIYYLNAVGEEMPFAPAWCVTDTHLLFSAFPQMLKATIDRGVDLPSSLGSRAGLVGDQTLALGYTDARRVFEILYPVGHIAVQLALSQIQREGVDLDISLLPTASSILPHLGVEVSRFESTEQGLLLQRTGTLPMADPILGGLGAQLLVPLILMDARAMPVPIRIRDEPPPPEPVPVEPAWTRYEITERAQVFDPDQEFEALPWPAYVTDAERGEVTRLLDNVKSGGLAAARARSQLEELGHKALVGIVNRLREVDYLDASETQYAHELNQILEAITITINAGFVPVKLDEPVDLRVAHWNANTVKAWRRFAQRYATVEDWDRLMTSIKSRRR